MRVVKIGGSLIDYAHVVMTELNKHSVLIVPGGGVFADVVRNAQKKHGFSDETAHKMAVLAMEQYGHFLGDISGVSLSHDFRHVRKTSIFLPFNEIIHNSGLHCTWDVASDTIACYVAHKLGEKEFIKLTDVDGILVNNKPIDSISAGKLLNTTTCLDKSLSSYLQEWKMNCRVVNGKSKSNIKKALIGESIGTLVTGGK